MRYTSRSRPSSPSAGVALRKTRRSASKRIGKRARKAFCSSSCAMSSTTRQCGWRGSENVSFGVTSTVRNCEAPADAAEEEEEDGGGAGAGAGADGSLT